MRLLAPHRDLPTRQPGALENLWNGVLPTESHDVHARYARDLFHLLNDLGAHFQTLRADPIVGHAAQSANHVVGHVHSRYITPHVTERPPRLERAVSGQDEGAFFKAQIARALHELGEDRDVVDELRR